MKFCPKCKRLFSDDVQECSDCRLSLDNIVSPDTEIVLLTASGFEKERVESALSEAQIPFSLSYKEKQPEKMSVDVVSADIIIPYSYYAAAVNLCVGIGALDEDCTEANFAEQTNVVLDEKEEVMSAAKRSAIKLVSAIAFLLLVALVVFGTDFVINFIKNLFK